MGKVVKTIPTVGFNVEEIKYKEMNFVIWDVGGQYELRVLLKHYYQNTDEVILVEFSSDRNRIGEAAEEFNQIFENEEHKDSTILVISNKQDIIVSLNTGEITEKLGLEKIKIRNLIVQGTYSINGQKLKEELDWLFSVFKLRERE